MRGASAFTAATGLLLLLAGIPRLATAANADLVYVRHGKSQGNSAHFWAAADGTLTDKGKMQAVNAALKLKQGGGADVAAFCGHNNIAQHQVFLSPLRRAFSTFLIMFIIACRNDATNELHVPDIRFSWNFREKRKSVSEDTNKGWGQSKGYIKKVVDRLTNADTGKGLNLWKHFKAKTGWRKDLGTYNILAQKKAQLIRVMETAYQNQVLGNMQGSNKGNFYAQLRAGDDDIGGALVAGKTSIAIVAHSGVGRTRFSCFLPDFQPDTATGVANAKLFGNAEYMRMTIEGTTLADWRVTARVSFGGPKGAGAAHAFLKAGAAPLMGSPAVAMTTTGEVGGQLDRYIKECRGKNGIGARAVFQRIEEGLLYFNTKKKFMKFFKNRHNRWSKASVFFFNSGEQNAASHFAVSRNFGGKVLKTPTKAKQEEADLIEQEAVEAQDRMAQCAFRDLADVHRGDVVCGTTTHKFKFVNGQHRADFKAVFNKFKTFGAPVVPVLDFLEVDQDDAHPALRRGLRGADGTALSAIDV